MLDDDLPPAFPKTERLKRQRRLPLWALIAVQAGGLLLVALLVAWWLVRDHRQAAPPSTVPSAPAAEETVITLPTLTPPPPTATRPAAPPAAVSTPPTPTPVPPTPTPTVQPPPPDPADDVVQLIGGGAVPDPPAGVDIAGCNIESDARLRPDVPPPFGAASPSALQVWLTLEEPIPAERTLDYHILVALDADGSQATGRPVGEGYINPDIGQDVGAGYILHPDGSADLYLYIWNPATGGWQEVEDAETIVQATFNEGKSAVVLSFDREKLAQAIESVAGFHPDLSAARGRIGVIASSQAEAAIVDFCPNRP